MQNDRTPAQKEKRRQEEISLGENLIIEDIVKAEVTLNLG